MSAAVSRIATAALLMLAGCGGSQVAGPAVAPEVAAELSPALAPLSWWLGDWETDGGKHSEHGEWQVSQESSRRARCGEHAAPGHWCAKSSAGTVCAARELARTLMSSRPSGDREAAELLRSFCNAPTARRIDCAVLHGNHSE